MTQYQTKYIQSTIVAVTAVFRYNYPNNKWDSEIIESDICMRSVLISSFGRRCLAGVRWLFRGSLRRECLS